LATGKAKKAKKQKILTVAEDTIPDISLASLREVKELSQAPLTLSRYVLLSTGFAEEQKLSLIQISLKKKKKLR
jgi:hypothetical protein